MDAPTLMNNLMEIERALTRRDECAVRNLIVQAQDAVLALEQENEALAIQNAGLRHRLDDYRRSPLKLLALKSSLRRQPRPPRRSPRSPHPRRRLPRRPQNPRLAHHPLLLHLRQLRYRLPATGSRASARMTFVPSQPHNFLAPAAQKPYLLKEGKALSVRFNTPARTELFY